MMKAVPNANIKNFAHKKTIDLSEETLVYKNKFAEFLRNVSDVALFVVNVIKNTFSKEFEFGEFIKQCYQIGNKSLPLISITGIVIGLVVTIPGNIVIAPKWANTGRD